MRKYENQSKQKFGKNACADLGNNCSIHLSYGGANLEKHSRSRLFAKTHHAQQNERGAKSARSCKIGGGDCFFHILSKFISPVA
jgi:hypothetical protein